MADIMVVPPRRDTNSLGRPRLGRHPPEPASLRLDLQVKIRNFAKELGFDLVGFSPAKIEEKNVKALKSWVAAGYAAKMEYMSEKERLAARCNLQKILPGAESVIVLAMNYYKGQEVLRAGFGRVARYAYGRDYHKIISKKLKELEEFICKTGAQIFPNKKIETKCYVDTGPILERSFAVQARIGVIGKNSSLITKDFGSWVFLAEVITNLDLASSSQAAIKSHKNAKILRDDFPSCGACQRCKNACPTGAIIAPGIIDARRCISYLTIEHKGKIPAKLAQKLAQTRRIFGCDICQEVCPHNFSRQKPTMNEALLKPKIAGDQLELKKILNMKTDTEFLKNFAGSPLMRVKRKGLRRNATLLNF
ncbi:MAG: tRNA epoxyqueuosine(34) reductase QueG [Patescibacteria group bacterium]